MSKKTSLLAAACIAACLSVALALFAAFSLAHPVRPTYNITIREYQAALVDAFVPLERASDENVVDTTKAGSGLLGISPRGSDYTKICVDGNGKSTNYVLKQSGAKTSITLPFGPGEYSIGVYNSIGRTAYLEESLQVNVTEEERDIYLQENSVCRFNCESIISLGNRICQDGTDREKVDAARGWMFANIEYDHFKAKEDLSGYTPNPARTVVEGRGICVDQASLLAALLRSQGVPCKIIYGFEQGSNVYHAWNQAYIDGQWEAFQPDGSDNPVNVGSVIFTH